MSKLEELKDNGEELEKVQLKEDVDDTLSRNVDFFSKIKFYIFIICFAVFFINLLLMIFLGPSYISHVEIPFDFQTSDDTQRAKHFNFDFNHMHFFQDFLTLDLQYQTSDAVNLKVDSTMTGFYTMFMNLKLQRRIETPQTQITAEFKNSSFSKKIRIFDSPIVDFNKFKSILTIKIPKQYKNIYGTFVWSYADASHSLIQILIRIILFIASLFISIMFLLSDVSLKKSHYTTRMMFYMNIALIFGSDPFYILTYFTEANGIKIYDAIVAQILVMITLFVSCVSMDEYTNQKTLLLKFIPFILGIIFYSASSIYSICITSNDPIKAMNNVGIGLSCAKIGFIVFYISMFISSSIKFHPEIKKEKTVLVTMGALNLSMVILSEIFGLNNEYITGHYFIQFYSIVSSGLYIIFFNYLNWPVDKTMLNLEQADEEKGEDDIIVDGLATELL